MMSNRAILGAYRKFLIDQAPTSPLFDTKRFTHHMERAYHAIWDAYRADGDALNRHIVVGPAALRIY